MTDREATWAVGTSGWRHLADFYPPRTREADTLSIYAEHFSLVEIDSTFQGIPGPERFAAWAAAVPAGFRFHVLGFGGLTLHQLRPGATPDPGVAWRHFAVAPPDFLFADFAAALAPLGTKLASVTLQFPAWFGAGEDSDAYLASCRKNLPGLPLAVELRNPSWFSRPARTESTLGLLIDAEIALVAADFEQVKPAPDLVATTTGPDLAVARLHGRSRGSWKRQAQDPLFRPRHRYSEAELGQLWADLGELARDADGLDLIVRTDPLLAAANASELIAVAKAPDPEPGWDWTNNPAGCG